MWTLRNNKKYLRRYIQTNVQLVQLSPRTHLVPLAPSELAYVNCLNLVHTHKALANKQRDVFAAVEIESQSLPGKLEVLSCVVYGFFIL